MNFKANWKPVLAVTSGSAIVLVASLAGGAMSSPVTWALCLGALLAQSSVLFLGSTTDPVPAADPAELDLEQRRAEFDEWQQSKAEELQQLSHRLNEKHRTIAEESARFQELAEYPIGDVIEFSQSDEDIRLSEKDRLVHALLEKEAELVYERIRNNEYTLNGTLNVDKVREDALNLVRQVARIYSPASTFPLLETSFEQLARAASRICLHSLVLLDQLPLDVKSYNVNEMYGYVRKAVQGYGTYKQAAPWIKHLSRGAYFGRFAAGANPVSLGAWWLATELGRRGAQKVVENYVDRQTVAVLHDIVTVVGVEAANIYGPGFRQRDPAWVYGTELTELLQKFPMSRESLSKGLQQITALPLRSEYDRIYLYKCLAGRKPAGNRLSDPSVLMRKDREQIASQLENFFDSNIHGVTDKDRAAWQEDVESRLDLKLQLGKVTGSKPIEIQAASAITAVYSFLVSVAGAPSSTAVQLIGQSSLMTNVLLEDRPKLLESLKLNSDGLRFEPPDLDPDSEMTSVFLKTLFELSIDSGNFDDQLQSLLLETSAYFRRSQADGTAVLDAAIKACLQRRKATTYKGCRLNRVQMTAVLSTLDPEEHLLAAFDGVSLATDSEVSELRDAVFVLISSPGGTFRAELLASDAALNPVWSSSGNVRVQRRKGYLIDDCGITGGTWHREPSSTGIVLAGSITGGGFTNTFGSLQHAFPSSEASPNTIKGDGVEG